jgi:hypothetical protein
LITVANNDRCSSPWKPSLVACGERGESGWKHGVSGEPCGILQTFSIPPRFVHDLPRRGDRLNCGVLTCTTICIFFHWSKGGLAFKIRLLYTGVLLGS